MSIPTPVHDLPAGMGGRFFLLVAFFVIVILALVFVFLPHFNVGYGSLIFVGSASIVLAILVNSAWDRITDKDDEDD